MCLLEPRAFFTTFALPPAEASPRAGRPARADSPHQDRQEAGGPAEADSDSGGPGSTTHTGQLTGRHYPVFLHLFPALCTPNLLPTTLTSPPPPSPLWLQSSPAADSYDLLSVCPVSDRVFLQACSVLPIDIVTVNLADKLPFTLKYSQLSQVYTYTKTLHTLLECFSYD